MNNAQLIDAGLALMTQINEHQLTVAGDTAVVQRLYHTPHLVATLIAQKQSGSEQDHANIVALFEKIDRHFNDSELRDLCFQLKVDYEDLAGEGKRDKARELVTMMNRHGRLPELVALASQLRPKVKWQDLPQQAGETDIVAKLDIAVVVDISRPASRDVARYLDDAEMDVNFLLLQNAQPDALLSPEEKWDRYVTAFAQTMDSIKHTFSGARLHFFFAAPGALIFGLGCIWGTVDEAEVYHYEKGTYYPVLLVSRELRR
ncbi:MAG: SAVED domain-containing protein [Chloroflexi bacterium]|nr:SAVED domain-containing protein [Chloroflexota bacterium]